MGLDGEVVASTSISLATSRPTCGASEQSCSSWWSATRKALCSLEPAIRSKVEAIGLSGQMHGAVLLNGACRPIRSVMLWDDARAKVECSDLVSAEPEIWQLSGVSPTPGIAAPKLLWLRRHEPELVKQVSHVLLPKDYLGFLLHGQFVTDPSDASGTSLFDQHTQDWSEHLCQMSGVDISWLPRVKLGNQIAGTLLHSTAQELGLPPDIPIAVGAGDVAAGSIGIGAIHAGDGYLSLGTSAQLFVTTAEYRPHPEGFVHAYAHSLPNRWFQMAAMLNGMRPLSWLSKLVERPIEVLLNEAENAQAVPLFLPYFSGEKTPHGDANIRGGFYGLSEKTTQGSLARAIVEAIAFSFGDAASVLSKTGRMPHTFFATGGGTKSNLIVQLIADIIQCRVGVSDDAKFGPALGAARLACVASGAGTLRDVIAPPKFLRFFEPQVGRFKLLEKRYRGYQALYPAFRHVHDTIS